MFFQGGATAMNATFCMNLIGRTGVADYIVTGIFTNNGSNGHFIEWVAN